MLAQSMEAVIHPETIVEDEASDILVENAWVEPEEVDEGLERTRTMGFSCNDWFVVMICVSVPKCRFAALLYIGYNLH